MASAETPGRGMTYEVTHNLLTLAGDSIYFNTNLGAVAAISARDGRLQWVSLYPRILKGDVLKTYFDDFHYDKAPVPNTLALLGSLELHAIF